MNKRISIIVLMFFVFATVIQLRVFSMMINPNTAEFVGEQSRVTISLDEGRADIYDRNMVPLTGIVDKEMVLALPGQVGYKELYNSLSPDAAAQLYHNGLVKPILADVESIPDINSVYTFFARERYYEKAITPHIIGYLDSEGEGATGLERAYNDELSRGGDKTFIECEINANGGLIKGTKPKETVKEGTGEAVQLTISAPMQRACEGIISSEITSGAIVVLDTQTSEIIAMASAPTYDPEDVGKSITSNDTGLMNRVTSAYNVGSVFKPIVAAAAIEKNFDTSALYNCVGAIEVAGHEYHCASNKAHGEIDLEMALMESCNCYFIDVAGKIGGIEISKYAKMMGFGKKTLLWNGFTSAAGNLPTDEQLLVPGESATLSFGQGKLLATPLQVATAYNVIAGDGVYRSPSIMKGVINSKTGKILENPPQTEYIQTIKPETATIILEMLKSVIADGIASAAAPEYGTAAGKTGTAQTGKVNEKGEEILDSWFAGVYPAEDPKYSIVIMEDTTTRTGEALASIFAKLCNSIVIMEND